VPVEDFPDTKVFDTWAVFKENLEGIINESVGTEAFQSAKHEVGSELGYDDDLERATKNIEGSARLVEYLYANNHRIPVFENIIEKVTQLRGY